MSLTAVSLISYITHLFNQFYQQPCSFSASHINNSILMHFTFKFGTRFWRFVWLLSGARQWAVGSGRWAATRWPRHIVWFKLSIGDQGLMGLSSAKGGRWSKTELSRFCCHSNWLGTDRMFWRHFWLGHWLGTCKMFWWPFWLGHYLETYKTLSVDILRISLTWSLTGAHTMFWRCFWLGLTKCFEDLKGWLGHY